jgi:hypothetical protein
MVINRCHESASACYRRQLDNLELQQPYVGQTAYLCQPNAAKEMKIAKTYCAGVNSSIRTSISHAVDHHQLTYIKTVVASSVM